MKTIVVSLLAVLALSALVVASSVMAQQPDKSGGAPSGDAKKEACMEMMQGTGEGKKAMQEFMQSPRAPQAMNNMMEMARHMGNGDAMLGMTKMMEMMGGQGSSGMPHQK